MDRGAGRAQKTASGGAQISGPSAGRCGVFGAVQAIEHVGQRGERSSQVVDECQRRVGDQRLIACDCFLGRCQCLRQFGLHRSPHPSERPQAAGEVGFERVGAGGGQPPADVDGLPGRGQRLLPPPPRIRDLGKITLCRDDTPTVINARYPHAGPLLSTRLNTDLIVDTWPDLLRMAGLLKFGEATASLIVGKWSAASRQNTLAAALKEWGTLRRTIHSARYLSDPVYRRKISRQLNKGESLHALRRDLHYANQGTIGKVHLEQQTEQAWCLTVLTNAVVTWSTEYYSLAVAQLRGQGRDIPDAVLTHISPAHSENINFFGVITVDVDAELAKLDAQGLRPLRANVATDL
jgi:hypothetical protein